VIGLVGVLAAPTGAAAAMFTLKEDYGYGPLTGGYREKHVRKSRGDGNAERHHGRAYGADDDDYDGPYRRRASHPYKHGYDADPGDGRIKHHSAGHRAPDGGDKGRVTSKQSQAASAAPTAVRRSNETARLHARRLSGAKLNVAKLNATKPNAAKLNAAKLNAAKLDAARLNAAKLNAAKLSATTPRLKPKPTLPPRPRPMQRRRR